MENKDVMLEENKDLLVNIGESPSQIRKETASFLRRETDSLDDFEHLEHDVNPVPLETNVAKVEDKYEEPLKESPPRVEAEHLMQAINTEPETVAQAASKVTEELKFESSLEPDNKTTEKPAGLIDMSAPVIMETPEVKISTDTPKVSEDLLGDLNISQAPPVPPHAEPIKLTEDKGFGDAAFMDSSKSQTQAFMDMERQETPEPEKPKPAAFINDLADRFSDSEPDMDDFKPSSYEQYSKTDDFLSGKAETFKDVIEDPEPALPEKDYFMESSSVENVPKFEPEPIKPAEPIIPTPAPVKEDPKPEPIVQKQPVIEPPKSKESKPLPKKDVIGAEAMFCKMGLGESYLNFLFKYLSYTGSVNVIFECYLLII